MIVRSSNERLTGKEAIDYIKQWEMSRQYEAIREYQSYYSSENDALRGKVVDREYRGKKPNYFVPTGYYSTLVDTMCGYLFQNIQYSGDEKIIEILDKNNADVKDMKDGIFALAYNRATEYVYTIGDGSNIEYKFTPIETLQVTAIYNTDIEPALFAAIRKYNNADGDGYSFDVIYNDAVETFKVAKDDNDPVLVDTRELLFKEVPMVIYNTELITEKSSFNSVLSYIKALDWVITGNTNELDRIVDAILVIGKKLKEDDRDHLDEIKTLEDFLTSDRAEYITKDMSPAFRQYLSEMLIQEIHKHSHVIDWYSPDSGLSGAASGKALKTRLFDMDMFSQRIEKLYREGAEKRIRLLQQVLGLTEDVDAVEITFNRTVPSDFEDIIQAFIGVDWITEETKAKKAGLDWELETERWEAQNKRKGTETEFDLEDRVE